MQHRVYTRRVNSNGEDVSPSVCACYYKAPQRQADNSGGYVLDFYRKKKTKSSDPIESHNQCVVQCSMSNQETRTTKQGENNGS